MWSTFVPYIPNSILPGAIAFVIAVTAVIMVSFTYLWAVYLLLFMLLWSDMSPKHDDPKHDESIRT
jgi:hypothetical protein